MKNTTASYDKMRLGTKIKKTTKKQTLQIQIELTISRITNQLYFPNLNSYLYDYILLMVIRTRDLKCICFHYMNKYNHFICPHQIGICLLNKYKFDGIILNSYQCCYVQKHEIISTEFQLALIAVAQNNGFP